MAASAQAYVRGSTVHFYEWLASGNRARLPQGPDIWICGDCHVGNLGPVANIHGDVEIQIRDFDQTVVGNPVYDLIRLGLSLAMAARGSDLPGITTAHMLEHMIEGYETAFLPRDPKNSVELNAAMPEIVKRLMRKSAGRSWKHLADERIEGVKPVIPRGRRFWQMTVEERRAIDLLFAQEQVRRLVTSLRSRDENAEIRVLDAAYWRKGCSSLGRLRFAVLAAVGAGKDERHCLMDIKEAAAPVAPRSLIGDLPLDNAHRVVEGGRELSPFLGERMLSAVLLGKAVFVRELMPQDLKIEIKQISIDNAKSIAKYLAHIVGLAHARQLSRPKRKTWLAELQHNRSKSLDAPSWLWNSVVALVAAHEAAYLNHCRRYALENSG
ncbi:hypothetical protein GCM10010909_00720 [Acidocella aquatica]|uniref:DUF2252 domain-containing protein n=2 Tax=Acidocella aquatica TaxID=1922313 RepID=A0ABQ5ZYW2_9PROT|nr:hypothetical protein GCM10010909_00720 [Acidocella aquatica]